MTSKRTFFTALTLLCLTLLSCSEPDSGLPQTQVAAPQLSDFSASPQLIDTGETSLLSWTNPTPGARLTLLPGDIDLSGKTTYQVRPETSTTYTLKLSKDSLTRSYSLTVRVRGETAAPAASPMTPPEERGLTGSKTLLAVNEEIGFAWNLSGFEDATCTFTPGDGSSYDVPDCLTQTSLTHVYAAPGAYVANLRAVSPDSAETFSVYPTVATYDPDTFNIDVVFLDGNMSASQKKVFTQAAARWAQVITADTPNYASKSRACGKDDERVSFTGAIDDLVIMASAPQLDGPGGTLGQAGPCAVATKTGQALYGVMSFDNADLNWLEERGRLQSTILHEMGHVLGIGTLWNYKKLIDEEAHAYTGEHALSEYRKLEDGVNSVPTEDDGGRGTANGHWEKDDFDNELMTGFLSSSSPLSKVTIGSLADLGYQVNYDAADTYPSPISLTPLHTDERIHLHSIPLDIEILED